MEFVKIYPQHKETEESTLFDFIGLDPVDYTGMKNLREVLEQYVFPLFETKDVHPDVKKNFIAFAALRAVLKPSNGKGSFLPQHSLHWLTFRRLFLAICDHEIPEDMPSVNFLSIGDSRPEDEKRASYEEHGSPELDETANGEVEDEERVEENFRRFLFAVCDSETPEPEREEILRCVWDASSEEIKAEILKVLDKLEEEKNMETSLESILPTVKEITKTRLKYYEGVTLPQVKSHFVETGRFEIGKECGALYQICENVPREYVPKSLSFPLGESKSTLHFLREIVEEEGLQFEMEEEYAKAARSMRGVLFDIAAEATLGRMPDPDMNAAAMERLYCERRLVEDPYSMLTEEQILFYVAEGMGIQGARFLNRIASFFETAGRKGFRLRHDPVKLALAIHWLDLEFPIWLMEKPAITMALQLKGYKSEDCGPEKIRDFWKDRSGSAKSALYGPRKKLIKNIRVDESEARTCRMVFRSYVENATSARALLDHTSGLAI